MLLLVHLRLKGYSIANFLDISRFVSKSAVKDSSFKQNILYDPFIANVLKLFEMLSLLAILA